MSWNPFNKLIAPRKSTSKPSEGNEFEERLQDIVQMEQTLKRMHKDTKKFMDSSSSLAKLEQKMVTDLYNSSKLIKDADELESHAEKLKTICNETENSQQQRDVITRSTFVKPLKGLNEKFACIHSAVKRKDQSQQDYLKYLAKRDKLAKDPSTSQSGKYEANEKYLERTKTDFERRTKQLHEDLPRFYSEAVNYFDPCFKAFLQGELNHNEKGKMLYDELAQDFKVPNDMTVEEFNSQVDKMLEEIKTISIVKAT